MKYPIAEEQPKNEPSPLTNLFLHDMPPARRSVAQYENSLNDFREQITYLKDKLGSAQSDREAYLERDRAREASVQEVLALRLDKKHLMLQFFLAMTFSVIGSSLISSCPLASVPIGFWIGWTMILFSIAFSLFHRLLFEFVCRKFPTLFS